MKEENNKEKVAMLVNAVLVLLEVNIFCYRVHTSGVLILASRFQYYAHYSNVLILISSVGLLAGLSFQLRGKIDHIWYGVRLMRFMAVSSALLTMIAVLLFILPLEGFRYAYRILFEGSHFYEYIVCPLIAYLSFVMLGDVGDFGRKEVVIASSPAAAYSIVMFLLNALGVVDGPYFFFHVHTQSAGMTAFWFIVGNAMAAALSTALLTAAHMESRKIGKNGEIPFHMRHKIST